MHTMHTYLLTTLIYLLKLSIVWTLDGKLILANYKNIMPITVLIVKRKKKQLCLHKLDHLRPQQQVYSVHRPILLRLWLKLKSTNLNILPQIKLMMLIYLKTSIGGTSKVLISLTHTEIKKLAVPAIQYHLLRLPSKD